MSAPIIPRHEIIIIPSNENNAAQECLDIRIEVFCREQKFPEVTEIDEYDIGDTATRNAATHFLLRLVPSNKPVGTIRAVKVEAGSYKLMRLAVLSEYRHLKFGRVLVEVLHDWIRKDTLAELERTGQEVSATSMVEVTAGAQVHAKGFYARFGYTPRGEAYYYDNVDDPQQLMVAQLSLLS